MGWTVQGSYPDMGKTFYSSPKPSTLALGPTQHSTQWIPGGYCSGMKLITHHHQVRRLRISRGVYIYFSCMPSCHREGKLYLYFPLILMAAVLRFPTCFLFLLLSTLEMFCPYCRSRSHWRCFTFMLPIQLHVILLSRFSKLYWYCIIASELVLFCKGLWMQLLPVATDFTVVL